MAGSFRVTLSTLVLAAILWQSPLAAQDDESEFLASYRERESQLVDRYIHNRRIRTTFKNYADERMSGTLQYEIESIAITRRDAMRRNVVIGGPKQPKQMKSGVLWLEDEVYNLEQEGSSYRLESHYRFPTHRVQVEAAIARSRVFLPLSFSGDSRLTEHFRLMQSQRERGSPFLVESVDNHASFENRPAIRVVTKGHADIRTTSYFDAESYAFLHYEKDGLLEAPNLNRKRPIRTTGTLTYIDGPEGFPIPKQYSSWFHMPDGRRIPRAEVLFTEYERYTPTDDDFDLEKQFGIKPFPKPPKPAAGGRWGRWLWIAAGLLAAITVGLLYYRRSRRETPDGSNES